MTQVSFMLNNDALQQLSQLKSSIQSSKEMAQGVVRTTTKRFGFVKLDDGREAFVDPEQMLRVLPDDRVEIEVVTNKKGQLEARLEKLISSPLKRFVGRYVLKGNAHFVEPDVPLFNRWLFIPPQERNQCQENDLILCEIARHPFTNQGKAQVRVLSKLGQAKDPGIESRYIAARYQLPGEWSQAELEQSRRIHDAADQHTAGLVDLTHLPFITIDAENTRDMDDAIHIEALESGWRLSTAIADPTRYIEENSPLELAAKARANTVYLLGHSISMMPVELAHDTFSLVPDQQRPALVCRMVINADGSLGEFEFVEALIRSHYKLSYQNVHNFLEGDVSAIDAPENIHALLTELHRFALVRSEHRTRHALVMEEKPDYFYQLNDQKKIERIEKRQRNLAHKLVEEAMLATNISAGLLFVRHPGYGIFSSHIGFRSERLDDVRSLVNEDKPEFEVGELSQLQDFQRLLSTLRLNLDDQPINATLQAILQRMLQAGALSFDFAQHFGLGFEAYATMTSPIRRYNDFYNHRAIKRILHGEPPQAAPEGLLEQLQEQISVGRQACRQLELWLCCQYVQKENGSVHSGSITQINAHGFAVRLDDIGVEGFVQLADKDAGVKPSFDPRRFCLTLEDKQFRLDQKMFVMITGVDVDKRRISLELVDSETADRLSVWSTLDVAEV